MAEGDHTPLARMLDGLVLEATEFRDVSVLIARSARAATARAFGSERRCPSFERRVRSYFWAVVRRRSVSRDGDAKATARLVAEAVVADLRETGRAPSDIWAELERGWSDRFGPELMDEYRSRLACG